MKSSIHSFRSLAPGFLLCLLLVPFLGACGSTYVRSGAAPSSYEVSEVPAAIEQARTELQRREEDDVRNALNRAVVAGDTAGLSPEIQNEVQRVLVQAAQARLEELTAGSDHAKELEEIAELELPRELSVRLSVEAARQWLAEGERRKCYKFIKKLDERYPMHAERSATGALLAEAGLSLANDSGRYGLFFHYRNLAPEVLVYFTTHYPEDPQGPVAYLTLARTYERKRRWELAIGYHEDLILFYPEANEAIASRAQIPQLRLAMLPSPEYDRSVVLLAVTELDGWLADHPAHALELDVKAARQDAYRRLADHDLAVARFYRTVDNSTGAEFHARESLENARMGGDVAQIEDASAMLAEVVGKGTDPGSADEDGTP